MPFTASSPRSSSTVPCGPAWLQRRAMPSRPWRPSPPTWTARTPRQHRPSPRAIASCCSSCGPSASRRNGPRTSLAPSRPTLAARYGGRSRWGPETRVQVAGVAQVGSTEAASAPRAGWFPRRRLPATGPLAAAAPGPVPHPGGWAGDRRGGRRCRPGPDGLSRGGRRGGGRGRRRGGGGRPPAIRRVAPTVRRRREPGLGPGLDAATAGEG